MSNVRALVMRPDDDDKKKRTDVPALVNVEFVDDHEKKRLKALIIWHVSGRAYLAGENGSGFTINMAARKIGLTTRIVKDWMTEDKEFAQQVQDAKEDAAAMMMTAEWERGVSGGGNAIERIIEYMQAGLDNSGAQKVKVERRSNADGVL